MRRVYLDHAATTPVLPEARAAMTPWLERPANASSLHTSGREAREALDKARETLCRIGGWEFSELTFVPGGTDAVNLAILGTALANEDPNRNVIALSASEHHAALECQAILARLGYRVRLLEVDPAGRPIPAELDERTLLVSVMHANNELGSLTDLDPWRTACAQVGAMLHVDACQTFPSRVPEADLISFASHKFGGPLGAAGLKITAGVRVDPITVGGGQERELRAGTENVAAIVGMAAAAEVRAGRNEADREAKRAARDAFESALEGLAERTLAHDVHRLEGHSHLRIPGIEAETLLIRLDRAGVEASAGAACSAGSVEPSHVLLASGLGETRAAEAMRFTFGPETSLDDAQWAAARTIECAQSILRSRTSAGTPT